MAFITDAILGLMLTALFIVAILAFVGYVIQIISRTSSQPSSDESDPPDRQRHNRRYVSVDSDHLDSTEAERSAHVIGQATGGRPSTGLSQSRKSPWPRTSRSRVAARWVPKGETTQVGGRNIGGMIYLGTDPTANDGWFGGNPFIDPSIGVKSRGGDYEGRGMRYWPSYSKIGARSRATYLDWLASTRSDTRYNVGYVFLYFYGLERRVFVDKTDNQERAEIVGEVHRLLEIYGDNSSVRRYLGAFIDAVIFLNPPDDSQPVFEKTGFDLPTTVSLALGKMTARNEPLTADWLLSWFLCSPAPKLRTPARRAFSEFRACFRHVFNQRFPNGLMIPAPRRCLKLRYHAASGSFTTDLSEHIGDVPDISTLTAPLRIAQSIADASANLLDKYSRHLGRNPDGRGTIEAHALLPEALWPLFPCPEKEELQTWATEQIESGGLVPVENVVEQMGGAPANSISKRHLIGMADAFAKLGVGLAPDPRFALRKPQLGEPVVLFRLPDDTLSIESPTEAYRIALLGLAVGTLVAHADGHLDQAERTHMAGQIDGNQAVTTSESTRLHANLAWMIAVPPDLNLLRNRLRNATEEACSMFGQLAVAAAGADGTIDPEEIRVIERLYVAMGLNRERVYTDLHALTSSPEPITVRAADPATSEFAIPPPPQAPAGTVKLDATRVSAVMADTARVSQVLGEIFVEPDDEDKDGSEERVEVGAHNGFGGLDTPHSAVVSVLITRSQWTEDEFAALANEHQLLAAGALETINEWAFGRFDESLVDVYEGYEISPDVAQQLMH